ncbi:TonB-dependent receptor [Asticcacaulis machinosus]|uniref:TonB-dependent receptor n=1 Tax=Asticcacaulis machinosus TaxID=2984211 RepID=A0ABT5HGN6_9CAUL|nr:TonB-dependent receptor [Asticcacaulis machinosus]MDC7675348.1 TonB-dependent receptor [Asticcacaulis machinosus]
MSHLFGPSRLALAVALSTFAGFVPAIAPAFAETQAPAAASKAFSIPEQSAAKAVQSFARQADLQILATAADLEGVRTNPVEGTFAVNTALEKLVAGTGLVVKSNDGKAAVLVKASAPSAERVAGTAQATAQAEADAPVEEVTVVGIRKSLRDAIGQKRASSGVAEFISAKEIGVLPDVTIAESLARLPGVNTSRDRGNDSQAAIRGIGPRMVLGTVNGREVATSEPDRNVRWEIYPSEVVAGAAVYKSSEARLLSGGISGTVDIQTIRPLSYSGPEFVTRAGGVYYDGGAEFPGYDGLGWRASGSWVKKVNDQFAFVIGLTGQNQKNGYESFRGWGFNDDSIRPGNSTGSIVTGGPKVPTPWGAGAEAKYLDSDRYSASFGAQYRPNANFELTYDLLYSKYKIKEDQNQAWYGGNNWGNWAGGNINSYTNPVIVDGDLIGATTAWSEITAVVARYEEDKSLLVTGLNGKWTYDKWTVSADLSYSSAERSNLWRSVQMNAYPASMTWLLTEDPSITVTQQPETLSFAPEFGEATPGRVEDELTAGQLDFKREFSGDFWTELMFGARYADRTKQEASGYGQYPAPLSVTIAGSSLQAYKFNNFNIPSMLNGDFDSLLQTAYGANAVNPDPESLKFNSEVSEKVWEAYVQANFESTFIDAPVSGNIGLRVVDVDSQSAGESRSGGGWFQNPDSSWTEYPLVVTTAEGGVSYTKVLPSASAKIEIISGGFLKLGAARVISRAPMNELKANRSLSPVAPYTGSAGNPYLKPFEADQLDIAYEYYFRPDSLFAVSGYHKNVKNYVGYDQRSETIMGRPYVLTSPVNSDKGGYISGVEFTFQTPFDTLFNVSWMEKFGIYSNLALVNSNIKEMVPDSDPLPMNGVADTTAILDLWYSDAKFEARLGAKYHSEYTAILGWDSTNLVRVLPETTLDFSAGYNVNDKIALRFQAGNLLDTPMKIYTDYKRNRVGDMSYYGRRFLFDVTYKF